VSAVGGASAEKLKSISTKSGSGYSAEAKGRPSWWTGDSINADGELKKMPVLLRNLLGFIILVATIGLATCQSLVKAEPSSSAYSAEAFTINRSQAE